MTNRPPLVLCPHCGMTVPEGDFCGHCGGMDNLLMMGQGGELTHAQTVDNLTLFARQVCPRLKAFKQLDAEDAASAVAA